MKKNDVGTLTREDFDAGPTNLGCVEDGLFIGNLTAATDIDCLEANNINCILTVDSCPLPRTITDLPGMTTKFLTVSDTVHEDLLSCIDEALHFIIKSLEKGNVLVHCYFGVSRSAAVIIAYLMKKYELSYQEAFERLKLKQRYVGPNSGFQSQLKLYCTMGWRLDPNSFQYRLYRLQKASYNVKQVKILPTQFMDVIKSDPSLVRVSPEPLVYRCRRCRRIVASASQILPHFSKERPKWTDDRLSEVAVDCTKPSSEMYCRETVFVEPMAWMEDVAHRPDGKLYCPKCTTKLGSFSWVMSCQCPCGAKICPAFYLVPSRVEWSNFVQNVQVTV